MEGGVKLEMTWLKRMNTVLDYIENNLDGEIDDNRIAVLSVSSKGMFQRIFVVVTDMPLSEYIRKRRLTQAAFDILNTNEKIIDIAVKYGYNSANAFSTAFKKFHGTTPSLARMSDVQLQSFQRFTFALTLSVNQGGKTMQYRNIDVKNAEDILQQMADSENSRKFLQTASERNGVKFVCDGKRVAVILPESVPDWHLHDAYFETGDESNPKFDLNKVFRDSKNNSFHFEISKNEAEDFKAKLDSINEQIICLNVNTMGIEKREMALALGDKQGERIISFNPRYLKEALNFIMCSDDEYIEIYYTNNTEALIMKSSCLYAAVLPVKLQ
jgi:AraC-like DNA-binding protein